MTILFPTSLLLVIVITVWLERFAQPSRRMVTAPSQQVWSLSVVPFRVLPVTLVFGCAVVLTGRCIYAVVLTTIIVSFLIRGSNFKRTLLGESLLFSDVAVVGEIFKHPRFYINTLSVRSRILAVFVFSLIVFSIFYMFIYDLFPRDGFYDSALFLRVSGVALVALAWLCLQCIGYTDLPRRLMSAPDCDKAIQKYGLLATTTISWLRWQEENRTILLSHASQQMTYSINDSPTKKPIVIVIQCESFADPQEILPAGGWSGSLSGLTRIRQTAECYGQLDVSGFGAYTMRTEYGVLFGHEEDVLGFRRFDPYLSAHRQRQDALPARLIQFYDRRLFIHPHDLRFYGRHQLMPAVGFNEMYGDEAFDASQKCGPHLSDHALSTQLVDIIEDAVRSNKSTFVFAVTIENHGPWPEGVNGYLRHLQHGDVLLERIYNCLEQTGHPAVLAFYGDHRPSIPGYSVPGGARHTPYLVQNFGLPIISPRRDKILTPASLHHVIYDAARRAAIGR